MLGVRNRLVDPAAWGRREGALAVTASLLVGASFLPWYGLDWHAKLWGLYWPDGRAASAWNSSADWSTAVLLGVTAAVLWIGWGPGTGAPRWAGPLAAVL